MFYNDFFILGKTNDPNNWSTDYSFFLKALTHLSLQAVKVQFSSFPLRPCHTAATHILRILHGCKVVIHTKIFVEKVRKVLLLYVKFSQIYR